MTIIDTTFANFCVCSNVSAMASAILQEEANFTRLSKLLVDKGTEALRNTLDAIHPPANLAAVLNANKAILLRLKPRVINDLQWDLLFPLSGNPPDSKTFDVSLLTVLLRNICGFIAPATGWNTMPPDADRSPQANFTRIRLFRNEVYAHVSSTQVDDATFENLWQKISQALVDLKIPRKEIDDLKISPLSPKEEIYLQRLEKWCQSDKDYKEILDELKTKVESLTEIAEESRQGIQQLCLPRLDDPSQKLAKHNFTAKIRRKVKSFHPGTRNWLLKNLEQWFTTDDEPRALLLTAGPGFGKSVFAAKVCELFKQKEQFAACHFCDFSNSNLNDPMLMLESLASQMCENIPGFKEKLLGQLKRSHKIQSLNDAFQIYLQNPLDELEGEPRLIVIDGLDESATNDKSDLVKLIADYFPSLPDCVKVLMTSRPELSLKMLSNIETTTIDVNAKENKVDLEEYLKHCIPSIASISNSPGVTALSALVRKCQGSFLYAYYIQEELRKRENLDTMTFQEVMSVLPQGIGSVYQDYFCRFEAELEAVVKSNFDLLKLLELLVAAKHSLPLSFFAHALDLAPDCRETKRIINKVNKAVSCLLYVSDDMVTVFHKSVCDWLLADGYDDHEYAVKASEGNKRLWFICEQVFQEIKATLSLGNDVKLTNEVEHAVDYGHEYLVASNMVDSFSWLVDIVILHLILILHPESSLFLQLIEEILASDVSVSPQLRQQITWHFAELSHLHFCYRGLEQLSTPVPLVISYLEAVLDYAPKGCFTDSEKQIAKALLAKYQGHKHVKRNLIGVNARKLLTAACKSFSPYITAVGVSSNKAFAAVGLEDGTICILSLPGLVKLWQYCTQCKSISCCTFAPDDSFVLYGDLETVLSIEEKDEASFFSGKVERFKSCAFSPNGNRLVTNDGTSTVKLWDVVKQCLISVLCATVPLSYCYFTNTGQFIIGDNQSSKEDSYCVWGAISLQRVDERSLSVDKSRERAGVIKSERCNRCLHQDRKEIIPPSLQDIPVIYNNVECILHLDQQSLRIIESAHFTTLAAWEHFLKGFLHAMDVVPFPRVTVLADELFLYIDDEKLVVLNAVPPGGQGCLPSPTRVVWYSFSPDGTRLASCTSDGFINIWNVDLYQVYRRFKSGVGASSAACWWSHRFLFVFGFIDETPSLSKYPVDKNFEVTTTHGESVSLCPVISEFSSFSGVLDFSEGYLSFKCGETKPVKVLNVNRSGPPESVILPGIRPKMRIAVSSGARFVLGFGGGYYLWKRSEAQPTRYDVHALVKGGCVMDCCFSIDSKLAVVSSLTGIITALDRRTFFAADLGTSGALYKLNVFGSALVFAPRVFCNNMELILVQQNIIAIFDLRSGQCFEISLQRCITSENVRESKMSPKGNVLAIPGVTGDMKFIRFNMREYSVL